MAGTAFSTSNWAGYVEHSADITEGSSALTAFSLLIDIAEIVADSGSDGWGDAVQSDGADIRCTDEDDTELPFDLIDFSKTDADTITGLIRVKRSLSASDSTEKVRIWAGYTGGIAVAYDANDVSGYGSDNAYDGNWEGYWPGGAGTDRTVNSNDTTDSNLTAGNTSGQLSYATSYNGTNSRADTTGTLPTGEPFTIFAWTKTSTDATTAASLADKDNGTNQHRLNITNDDVICSSYDGTDSYDETATNQQASGDWEHACGVWGATNSRKAYSNGASGSGNSVARSVAGEDRFTIGVTADSTPYGFFNGDICEVQIHSTNRSADWISHEYDQTSANDTFWGTWTWDDGASGTTVDCTAGAITIAGNACTITAGTTIDCTAGAVSLAGYACDISVGTTISCTAGALAIAGANPTILAGTTIDCTAGALVIAGNNVDVEITGTTTIACTTGAVVIAGQNATITAGTTIDCTAGAVVIAGNAVEVSPTTQIDCTTGALVLTGYNVSISAATTISCTAGALEIAGYSVTITTGGETTPDGVDYRVTDGRPHYRVTDGRPHYTVGAGSSAAARAESGIELEDGFVIEIEDGGVLVLE